MEAAGVPPRQILAAATVENARFFRLEDRYGTIEPGKIASLLLLRDDPLGSTAAFDTIDTVILKGRIIPRSTLARSRINDVGCATGRSHIRCRTDEATMPSGRCKAAMSTTCS